MDMLPKDTYWTVGDKVVYIETWIDVDGSRYRLFPKVATTFSAVRWRRDGTSRWISESVSHKLVVSALYIHFIEMIHCSVVQPENRSVFV